MIYDVAKFYEILCTDPMYKIKCIQAIKALRLEIIEISKTEI